MNLLLSWGVGVDHLRHCMTGYFLCISQTMPQKQSFSTILGNADLDYSKAPELPPPQNEVEIQLALWVHFGSVAIQL